MRRDKKCWRKLKSENKGAAMITTLCVMAVLMALACAILLAANVLIGNAQRSMAREQCRVSSVSISTNVIDKQMEAAYADSTYATENEGLRAFLRTNIGERNGAEWKYYNDNISGHGLGDAGVKKIFDLSGLNDDQKQQYGTTKVTMYWEWEQDPSITDPNTIYDDTILVVRVTTSLDDQKYSITSRYQLKCNLESSGNYKWDWTQIWKE